MSVITYLYNFIKRDFVRRVWRYEGVIRIRKSKTDRKHHGKQKTDTKTNNDLQNIHIKVKIEQDEPHYKPGVNSGVLEE